MRDREMWWSFRFASPFGMAAAGYAIIKTPAPDPEAIPMDLSVWFLLFDVHPAAVLYALFCAGLFVLSTRRLRRLGYPS